MTMPDPARSRMDGWKRYFPASRRFNSASIASRMNTAIRFGPTNASIRRRTSSVKRTIVGFTFIGGRPMRLAVTAIGKFVKVASISAIAY